MPSAVLHGLYSSLPSWTAVQAHDPMRDNARADTAAQRLSAAFAKLSQEDQQDALAAVEALRRTTTSAAVEPAMDKVQETSDKDEQARETVESPVQPLPSAELVETVESNQLVANTDAPTQAQASLSGDVVETVESFHQVDDDTTATLMPLVGVNEAANAKLPIVVLFGGDHRDHAERGSSVAIEARKRGRAAIEIDNADGNALNDMSVRINQLRVLTMLKNKGASGIHIASECKTFTILSSQKRSVDQPRGVSGLDADTQALVDDARASQSLSLSLIHI